MIVDRGRSLLIAQVGKPYIFGYEVKMADPDPKAFDCSELVQWFYHQMGVTVPDGSWNQYAASVPIKDVGREAPGPFDVNFLLKNGKTPFHVVMYMGEGNIIHAKGEKFGVVMESTDYLWRNAKLASGWRQFKALGVTHAA